MNVYFNEFDSFAAAWLKELWPDATVDARSIVDVAADDISGFNRVHFFGGIGGWEYALQLARWPSTVPVWSGSCPCQPFSQAGKKKGTTDERHLWPEMRRLIAECRPAIIFGEQVSSPLGREWLAGIRADLEAVGYEVGAADLPACSIGAPHRRQRLFWVANMQINGRGKGSQDERGSDCGIRAQGDRRGFTNNCNYYGLANANGANAGDGTIQSSGELRQQPENSGVMQLGNTSGEGLSERISNRRIQCEAVGTFEGKAIVGGSAIGKLAESSCNGVPSGIPESKQRQERHTEIAIDDCSREPWSDYYTIPCRDGKARRVGTGIFPLVDGLSRGMVYGRDSGAPFHPAEARAKRLHGYGNAIVPQVAAVFIQAFMEILKEGTS